VLPTCVNHFMSCEESFINATADGLEAGRMTLKLFPTLRPVVKMDT
jgi:hypothetical protein